jgi:hypothetical protein
MGIRVRKLIGYGITDLKTGKDPEHPDKDWTCPDDPRWDYAAYREGVEGWYDKDLAGYLEWLKVPENANRVLDVAEAEGWYVGRERTQEFGELYLMRKAIEDIIEGKRYTRTSPSSNFHYDNEFGDAATVLFQCPEHPDWSRYDDIIDYYEEEGEGRRTPLKGSTGIWPYDGFMKRVREPSAEAAAALSKKTGLMRAFAPKKMRELDGSEITELGGGEYNQLSGFWDPRRPPLIESGAAREHLLKDWRPRVPMGVIALMEFMGCFPKPTDPDSMLNSLRPMIYVYWA